MKLIAVAATLSFLPAGCAYWHDTPIPAQPWTPTVDTAPSRASVEPAAKAGSALTTRESLEERLRTLKALQEEGLITTEEMKRRREEILNEL